MHIEAVKILNYRNIGELELAFSPGLNMFTGKNAQGKTNIVEAVYMCSAGRSHRTQRDAELVRWGQEGAYIKVALWRQNARRTIEMRILKDGKKQIKVDSNPIKKIGQLMGCLNAVIFSPEDLQLIKDGPGARRRFVNMELCQMRPAYFYELSAYQQVLGQRNAYLKELSLGKADGGLLDVYDEQLSAHGCKLIQRREEFIEKLKPLAEKTHLELTQGEKLTAEYVSCVGKASVEAFQAVLKKYRQEDIRRGVTEKGPHKDDIVIKIDGADTRVYCSQGQQRTAALSLKLSELVLMEQMTDEKPILILDDVWSELDDDRQKKLAWAIRDYQTLATSTFVPVKAGGKVFRVSGGKVRG